MKLVSFSYNDQYWQLNDLNLQTANLIVGRNASGKSRALRAIYNLSQLIEGKNIVIDDDSEWRAEFITDSDDLIDYSFSFKSSLVAKEYMSINAKPLIRRNFESETCHIWPKENEKPETFSPPKDQLVIHVRRDTAAYPDFETLIAWSQKTDLFSFGEIIPNSQSLKERQLFADINQNTLSGLADLYLRLNEAQRGEILLLMSDLGYNIIKILSIELPFSAKLSIDETGLGKSYDAAELSQGTYRILFLLTFIQYAIYHNNSQLICIDDLGEGLDYQPAIKLGKYIYDLCENSNIQLIATSNDGFIMDSVPIEYWNVLRRNGSKVIALNEKNQPELFDRFAYTGLSNFDFFSSDYIDSRLK